MSQGLSAMIIIAYFALIFYVGYRASKKVSNAEEYMVGGRDIGFVNFMVLIIASMMSGMTLLGASGLGYLSGWPSMWEAVFVCLSIPVLMIMFGAKIHRVSSKYKYNTMQDYLAHRYDSPVAVRTISAIAGILMSFIYLVGQFRAISIVLGWLLGLNHFWSLLIATVIVTVYVFLGGLFAVAKIAMFQGVALFVGVLTLIPIVVNKAGGLAHINQNLALIDPSMVAVAYPQIHPTASHSFLTPLFLLSFFFLLSFGLATAPHALNNVLTAREGSYYEWGPVIGFVVYFVVFGLIKFGGFAARSMVVDGMIDAVHPDYALIASIEYALPSVAWSLFGVIVLAAVMSTTDRLLLTIATLFTWDVYKQYLHPKASDGTLKKVIRGAIVITAVLAFLLAVNPPELLAWLVWMGIGLMLSVYCVPLLAGLYWKRATRQGGLAGMLGGLAVALVAGYWHQFVAPLPVHFSIFGLLASAILLVVVSLATTPVNPEILAETETGFHF
jgi:sodium/proline symporter